jgi:curved DNA-binding protein CbpA
MNDVGSDDLYRRLGVEQHADETTFLAALKTAYRRAVLVYHPDKNMENEAARSVAEANFKRIGEAFAVLGDASTRSEYDRKRAAQRPERTVSFDDDRSDFFDGAGGSDCHKPDKPYGSFFDRHEDHCTGTMPRHWSNRKRKRDNKSDHGEKRHQSGLGSRVPSGSPVLIRNLTSANSLHQNGKTGHILRYDFGTERYTIALGVACTACQRDGQRRCSKSSCCIGQGPESATWLALKRDSIMQLARGVVLTGLREKPELNGQSGDMTGFHSATGRYCVRLRAKTGAAPPVSAYTAYIRMANIILPAGTNVKITALQKHTQLNGQWAKVLGEHDPHTGRCNVGLSNDLNHQRAADKKAPNQLSIKPDNVAL